MNTYLGACRRADARTMFDPKIIQHSKITYLEGYLWDPPLAKQGLPEGGGTSRTRPGHQISA